jgi:Uma2 family endonuclease
MTAMTESRPMPWTEDEYFALGETAQRIELFDGSLFVSTAPTFRHQTISSRLYVALVGAAGQAGLEVLQAINVRLRTGRIPIPDLVIAYGVDPDGPVLEADRLWLVCEITSPSNAATDRVLKMHYYAVAGVPWYLLVEPDGPTMVLYRLDDSVCVEDRAAVPGTPMPFPEPVNVAVDPAHLVGTRS